MIKKGFWKTVLFTSIHKKICYVRVSIESLQLFCYIFAIKSFKLVLIIVFLIF